MRRAELLVENGYPVTYLDEIVSCPLCRDSGMVDGKICSCLEKLYNQELTSELATLLQHGDESFDGSTAKRLWRVTASPRAAR